MRTVGCMHHSWKFPWCLICVEDMHHGFMVYCCYSPLTYPLDSIQSPLLSSPKGHSSITSELILIHHIITHFLFSTSRSAHAVSIPFFTTPHDQILNPRRATVSRHIPLLAKPATEDEPVSVFQPFLRHLWLLRSCALPSVPILASEIAVRSSTLVLKSYQPRRLIIHKGTRHHPLPLPRLCCWHFIDPMHLPLWR